MHTSLVDEWLLESLSHCIELVEAVNSVSDGLVTASGSSISMVSWEKGFVVFWRFGLRLVINGSDCNNNLFIISRLSPCVNFMAKPCLYILKYVLQASAASSESCPVGIIAEITSAPWTRTLCTVGGNGYHPYNYIQLHCIKGVF